MTTIAVKRMEDGQGVIFASDTQTTTGNERSYSEKVFQVGPVVFGMAGRLRDLNVVKHHLKAPTYTARDKADPEKWVVTKLIPELRKVLHENGRLEVNREQESSDSVALIALDGLCGEIGPDFSLSETGEPFWAIGSGSQFAKGAMAVGASARDAVEVASAFDVYTGPPSETQVTVRFGA